MELNRKEIIIKDACILIDLVELELLELFFRLEIIAFTTGAVIGEITNEMQLAKILVHINNGELKIDSGGELEIISKIADENPGLSIADSSVLELAMRKEATIFSSDGALRKISIKKGLIVKGLLWIIEEMCIKNILTVDRALERLTRYVEINQRSAPKNEMEKLINKLKNN